MLENLKIMSGLVSWYGELIDYQIENGLFILKIKENLSEIHMIEIPEEDILELLDNTFDNPEEILAQLKTAS